MRSRLLNIIEYDIVYPIMGVIYTSSELAGSEVPEAEAHKQAAIDVLDHVGGLDNSVLTMIHGSVPEGRSNVRSDLDVLVTYVFDRAEDEPHVTDKIKEALDDIGADTGVKIEANLWPADEPASARQERMYDLLFSHHLARSMANEEWRVGEVDGPIMDIASVPLDTEAVRRVALNYTTYKHSGFTKAPRIFNENDTSAISALQRAFEFPKAAGRKVGQLVGTIQQVTVDDYRKVLRTADGQEGLLDTLEQLRGIDVAYTELLEHLHSGATDISSDDIAEYGAWLQDRYPKALHLGMIAASGLSEFVSEA